MEKKSLFKEYEEWCVKNNKDPQKEENVSEFFNQKRKQEAEEEKNSKAAEKKELVEKQKEIFKSMCEYAGVKAPYNEDAMFEALDREIRSVAGAAALLDCKKDIEKILDKVLDLD